ncbi:MAG: GPW/gp25 family protein [Flavobacteriaceae bacterium]
MKNERPFTGSGWSFPPTFDKVERKVLLTSDKEDIEKSLEILLGTIKGERIMQPSFGCNMDEMVFESFNLTTKNYLIDLVQTAILYHEARIEPLKIALDESFITEGRILIEIDYIIRSSNSRFNMVYPFYINEASEIPNKSATPIL